MKFQQTFRQITDFLQKEELDHALIGAFAMQAYGYVRATRDLDLVVNVVDQATIIAHMESLGYETLHCSPGFSNHIHADFQAGRIDFVYVSGRTAQQLFQAARPLPLFDETPVPVVSPEHLAALKIFAMKNNPDRALQDMADVQFLLSLPDADEKVIKEYFHKYGQMDRFHEIANNTHRTGR